MKTKVVLSCLVLMLSLAATTASADCLFVNTSSSVNTVAAFQVNADGSLVPAPGSPFSTGGAGGFNATIGSAGLCAGNGRLYATNTGSADVAGFVVADDCSLATISGSPFTAGTSAIGVLPDPQGNFLYVSNFNGNTISIYLINAAGSLTEIAGSPFPASITPFDLAFSPDGALLFVSQDFADAVGVYDVDTDGSISPIVGSPFPAGVNTLGLAIDSVASLLYSVTPISGSISGFTIASGGALAPTPGSPYPTVGNIPIEIVIDPTDSIAYVSNNSAGSISANTIAADGTLAPIAGSPFASDSVGPSGLAFNGDASVLYVANGALGGNPDVSVYAVAADGSLAPIAGSPFATGGTGNGSGVVFLSMGGDGALAVPTVSGAGMAVFATVILLAGMVALRRRLTDAARTAPIR